MIKAVILSAALVGGAYASGVFDIRTQRYQRIVDRPANEVAAALDDLDIRHAPGSPASDPSRSGGVKPTFTRGATSTGMVFTIHSGEQVAVRLFADLEAVDGGKRTKVTTRVERGDAPDDFVAPAFRSTAITTGLFNVVVDADLDALTRPKGDPERCRALLEKSMYRMLDADAMHQDNLKDALGDNARMMMEVSAMQQELNRAGCDTSGTGEIERPKQEMVPGPRADY